MTLDDLDARLRARLVELGDEQLTKLALRSMELDRQGLATPAVRRLLRLLGFGDEGRGRLVRPDVTDDEIALWEAVLDVVESVAEAAR